MFTQWDINNESAANSIITHTTLPTVLLPNSTMTFVRALNQWELPKNETVNSIETGKHNLLYILSLDTNYAPFPYTWF